MIDSVHPLSQADRAFRRLLDGAVAGKIVVTADGGAAPLPAQEGPVAAEEGR